MDCGVAEVTEPVAATPRGARKASLAGTFTLMIIYSFVTGDELRCAASYFADNLPYDISSVASCISCLPRPLLCMSGDNVVETLPP